MEPSLHDLGFVQERINSPYGTLCYQRRDTREGTPLVCLHSLAMSSEMWSPIIGSLCNQCETILPDSRGHGGSSWDGADYTIEDLSVDLLTLLDRLGTERVQLLGLSMGGSVALTFASLYPERVAKLVLCDTTAWYGKDAPQAWAERADSALTIPRAEQLPFQIGRWFSDGFQAEHPDTVDGMAAIFKNTNSQAHAAACRALGTLDSRQLLTKITAPTLIVTGKDDRATPIAMGKDLHARIVTSSFVEATGAHFAIFETEHARRAVASHLS